jgi:hypothetical protein
MMSKYEQHYSVLNDSDFRRLTGVHKTTFEHMLAVLSQQISQTKKVAGRPSRLLVADQLLMMLEYNPAGTVGSTAPIFISPKVISSVKPPLTGGPSLSGSSLEPKTTSSSRVNSVCQVKKPCWKVK